MTNLFQLSFKSIKIMRLKRFASIIINNKTHCHQWILSIVSLFRSMRAHWTFATHLVVVCWGLTFNLILFHFFFSFYLHQLFDLFFKFTYHWCSILFYFRSSHFYHLLICIVFFGHFQKKIHYLLRWTKDDLLLLFNQSCLLCLYCYPFMWHILLWIFRCTVFKLCNLTCWMN